MRELREQAGLTQGQLAEMVGCTWEAVSRWERGAREPGWTQVLALTEALGVSCEAFTTPPAAQPAPKKGRPRKAAPGADPAAETAKGHRRRRKRKGGDGAGAGKRR